MEPTAGNAALRRSIYALLICIGLGAVVGRILAVDSVDKSSMADSKLAKQVAAKRAELEARGISGLRLDYAVLQARTELAVSAGLMRPFFSANDRSRWCAVRALVEPDMRVPGAPYAIDKVIDAKLAGGKLKMRPGWDTIDLVFHDGHYYSSKPPLESTLMAAEYWAIYHATGKSLGTHPYEIGRFMLVTINGGCLLLMFVFTARLIERLGTSDWGRIFVMACCVFGTFLTTFAVTITNHLPAAACTAVLLDALVRIWFDGDRRTQHSPLPPGEGGHRREAVVGVRAKPVSTWTFVVAGFFSALLAANEIPAGLLSALATLVVFCASARKTLTAYLPPALLVMAAFFGTNWIAVHDLKPAQMHRGGSDNWYDYPGSYWKAKQGIDAGEKSAGVYALNVLVGHHGIFSLTPMWLLFLVGTGIWLVRSGQQGAGSREQGASAAGSPLPPGDRPTRSSPLPPGEAPARSSPLPPGEAPARSSPLPPGEGQGVRADKMRGDTLKGEGGPREPLRLFALLGLVVTLVCLAFYIWYPGVDRNYGGNASALRWVFWLAPLWLVLMLPAADLMARRRWSRAVALLLLAASALSCHYPTWNPWTAPWIMNFLGYMDWL